MEILKEDSNTRQAVTILFVKVAAKSRSQQKALDALLADVNGARTEPGNLKMELYKAANDPDAFYLFERWQTREALDDHFSQPYTQGAFDLQVNDLTEPIEMNYLEEIWPDADSFRKEPHQPLTTLIVPFQVKPEFVEEFEARFEKFVAQVRRETGNREFHFHRIIDQPGRFVLYERWESQAHLDDHNRLPSTAAFIADISPMLTRPLAQSVLIVTDIS